MNPYILIHISRSHGRVEVGGNQNVIVLNDRTVEVVRSGREHADLKVEVTYPEIRDADILIRAIEDKKRLEVDGCEVARSFNSRGTKAGSRECESVEARRNGN